MLSYLDYLICFFVKEKSLSLKSPIPKQRKSVGQYEDHDEINFESYFSTLHFVCFQTLKTENRLYILISLDTTSPPRESALLRQG